MERSCLWSGSNQSCRLIVRLERYRRGLHSWSDGPSSCSLKKLHRVHMLAWSQMETQRLRRVMCKWSIDKSVYVSAFVSFWLSLSLSFVERMLSLMTWKIYHSWSRAWLRCPTWWRSLHRQLGSQRKPILQPQTQQQNRWSRWRWKKRRVCLLRLSRRHKPLP